MMKRSMKVDEFNHKELDDMLDQAYKEERLVNYAVMLAIVTALLIGFLAWAIPAHAACLFQTYTAPDGTVIQCSTCCYSNSCNTTCI